MYVVYILQSEADGSFYVGQTLDLPKRLKRHNSGSEKATRSKIPWRVVYSEEFPTRALAMKREKQIKARKKRAFIEKLVATHRGVAQSHSERR